jgi:hypothetical protein
MAARVINARPMRPSKNCAADLPVEFQNVLIMDSSRAIHLNAPQINYPSKGRTVSARCQMLSRNQLPSERQRNKLLEISAHDSDIHLPLSRLKGNTGCRERRSPVPESIDEGEKQ